MSRLQTRIKTWLNSDRTNLIQGVIPALLWVSSGLLVVISGYLPLLTFNRCRGHYFGYSSWFSNWDGQWYQYIADRGYFYADAGGQGPQVFFPLYPVLGNLLDAVTPLNGQLPLVAVSWLSALCFSYVWIRYANERLPQGHSTDALWGLALILYWPASYFLRVSYTESLYLLLLTIFFYGCARAWRPAYLVLVVGLVTATRPTGILLCPVLAIHLYQRNSDRAWYLRLFVSLVLAGLSAWGLYAYMVYLYVVFEDPLLFVSKQAAWNTFKPASFFITHWKEMLSLRPAWEFLFDGSLYDSATYASNFQNKLLWLLALPVTAIGVFKKWLSKEEALFCVFTISLIYYTHAPRNMESIGRYLATLVPLYLVTTRFLMKLAPPVRVAVITFCGSLLVLQTSLFRHWHCNF